MKRYKDLTKEEQVRAREKALEDFLIAIIETGGDILADPDLRERVGKAGAEADQLQTPWFTASILMEDPVLAEALTALANVDAKTAHYPELGEQVLFI